VCASHITWKNVNVYLPTTGHDYATVIAKCLKNYISCDPQLISTKTAVKTVDWYEHESWPR